MHALPLLTKDLVLIGGGHTHALVLKHWTPLPGVRLTLINPEGTAPYTGMLPGYVAGHYERAALDIDLVKLARQAGARLVLDKAIGINIEDKRVLLADRPPIAYDTLSVNVGITSNLPSMDGFAAHGHGAKPLGPFSLAWDRFVMRVEAGEVPPHICVIGAGVGGVELALAMAHRLSEASKTEPQVTLVEATDTPLAGIGYAARKALLGELKHYGIKLVLNADVSKVNASSVLRRDTGEPIPSHFTVSAAGARPHDWIGNTGLPLRDGYIVVSEILSAEGATNIFAAGDCAHLAHSPRPKAGVFAVREAPVLANNLRADLGFGRMRPYKPQKNYLKLISVGRQSAIFDKFGIAFKGAAVWQWKDQIDRKFMDQFVGKLDADDMKDPVLCAGCGAKVSQSALASGLGDKLQRFEDAVITGGPGNQRVLTTDHLRAMTPDPWLMGKVAAVHAMGDIWAMGAKPETALATVILPHMSERLQADTLRELMAGAGDVFSTSGAAVRGGHSSMGAELTVGFTIEGALAGGAISLAGAQAGDHLVLTKPIGTGTLLAAEMHGHVDAAPYLEAVDSMVRPMDTASEILSQFASAMTDVTGFGLAGHLLNMLEASGLAAELTLGNVPVLKGAETLCRAGIKSSLWDANARVRARTDISPSPRGDLLFDPQTCGGLLASIPATKLDDMLAKMKAAGEPIWVIGKLCAGAPFIKAI